MHYPTPDIRFRCFDSSEFRNGDLAKTKFTVHDVVHIPCVYNMETYMSLADELESINERSRGKLLIPWHKANHLIANDKYKGGSWKNECPTFQKIIDDITNGFNIAANATRVNIYRSGENGRWGQSESKPFHHDRAAKTPGLSQNITVGVSLGRDREVAFRHTKKKKSPDDPWYHIRSGALISTTCRSGSIYAFARDVNCEFQHGVLPSRHEDHDDLDRISIIVWGTHYTLDKKDSRVSHRNIPTARELGIRERNKKYDSTN